MCELKSDPRFCVIGYGSWATTLVGVLTRKAHVVRWHIANDDVREVVLSEGYNPKYASNLEFDRSLLKVSGNLDEVVSDSDIVILATPSAFLKKVLATLTVPLSDKFVISAVKGIVPDEGLTVLEYVHKAYGLSFKRLGLISGPSHAEEVSRGKLSYLTVVCKSQENAALIAGEISCNNLIVSTSDDIYGVEYAAILKNVYAIAAGIANGLGYGDNFLAVLIAHCAFELAAFMDATYPFERNVARAAYLGDLLVTCYSPFSRNRQLGTLIGKGCSVDMALSEMTMVAEGYYAAKSMHNICENNPSVEMPIAELVYRVLYEGARPRKAMAALAKKL